MQPGPLSRLQRQQETDRRLAAVWPGIYRAITHGQHSPATIGVRAGVRAVAYQAATLTYVPPLPYTGIAVGLQATLSSRHKQARYRRAARREVRGLVAGQLQEELAELREERIETGRAEISAAGRVPSLEL